MAEVTDDFLASLRRVRGEFENTRGGKIGNRVLAHVFSTLFPLFFLVYYVFWSRPGWPLTSEQWLFLGIALVTFMMGLFIHRSINSRFVFDDEGVQEWRGNTRLNGAIAWKDLKRVDFRESRGIRTFTLVSDNGSIQLEYYKSLSEAIADLSQR